jgi:hypothetical protein
MTAPTLTAEGPPPKDDWSDLDDTSLVPTGKTARDLNKPSPDQFARTDVASGVSLGSRASTSKTVNQVAMFKCDACRGTGHWYPKSLYSSHPGGPCHKCKGTGKLKTDPETRARRKKAADERKKAAIGTYIAEHVAEYTWAITNMSHFGFALSMCEAIKQHGHWTEGQLTAIRKCMARDEEREKEREATKAAALVITGEGFDRMLTTFTRARASGLKWPKLRIDPYVFALAGERSKYAGRALFVKHNNDGYLGRIDLEGRWFPSDAGRGHDDEVRRICQDPLAAAVLHGKQTGHCACCGLELTNEESVRLGIGPICREKWGL